MTSHKTSEDNGRDLQMNLSLISPLRFTHDVLPSYVRTRIQRGYTETIRRVKELRVHGFRPSEGRIGLSAFQASAALQLRTRTPTSALELGSKWLEW